MGRDQRPAVGEFVEQVSPFGADLHWPAEYGAAGRGAEADHHIGVDDAELGLQPRMTGDEMSELGLLVDPALAPLLMAKVLDSVGQVDLVASDSRLFQRVVQHASRQVRRTAHLAGLPGRRAAHRPTPAWPWRGRPRRRPGSRPATAHNPGSQPRQPRAVVRSGGRAATCWRRSSLGGRTHHPIGQPADLSERRQNLAAIAAARAPYVPPNMAACTSRGNSWCSPTRSSQPSVSGAASW